MGWLAFDFIARVRKGGRVAGSWMSCWKKFEFFFFFFIWSRQQFFGRLFGSFLKHQVGENIYK